MATAKKTAAKKPAKKGAKAAKKPAKKTPKKTAKKPAKKASKKKQAPKLSVKAQVRLVQEQIQTATKGSARLTLGKDYVLPYLTLRRPTGLLSLDIALAGGFAAGGPSQIIGKPSSGKTWLAFHSMAEVQRYYGDGFAGAVALTENRFDKLWVKSPSIGVRTALSENEIYELETVRKRNDPEFTGFSPEELDFFRDQVGAGVSEIVADTAENLYEAVLRAVAANVFQVIIVDSLGAMLPALEAEGTMEDDTYAGASSVNTKFMHKYQAIMNRLDADGRSNETTLLFINQYRVNVGGSRFAFGPRQEMSEQGGWSIKHHNMANLYMESGSIEHEDEIIKEFRDARSKMIHWNVIKQKAGGHEGAKGKFVFDFGTGADVLADMTLMGVLHGVVQKKGSWYSLLGPSQDPDDPLIKGQGLPAFKEELVQMPNLQGYLRAEVMKAAGMGDRRYGPL